MTNRQSSQLLHSSYIASMLSVIVLTVFLPMTAFAVAPGYDSVKVDTGKPKVVQSFDSDYWLVIMGYTRDYQDVDLGHVIQYDFVDSTQDTPASVPCYVYQSSATLKIKGYDSSGSVADEVTSRTTPLPHLLETGKGDSAVARQPFPIRLRLPDAGNFTRTSVTISNLSLLVPKSAFADSDTVKAAFRLRESVESPDLTASLPSLPSYTDGFRFATQKPDGSWMTDAEVDSMLNPSLPDPDPDPAPVEPASNPVIAPLADGLSATVDDGFVAVSGALPYVLPVGCVSVVIGLATLLVHRYVA